MTDADVDGAHIAALLITSLIGKCRSWSAAATSTWRCRRSNRPPGRKVAYARDTPTDDCIAHRFTGAAMSRSPLQGLRDDGATLKETTMTRERAPCCGSTADEERRRGRGGGADGTNRSRASASPGTGRFAEADRWTSDRAAAAVLRPPRWPARGRGHCGAAPPVDRLTREANSPRPLARQSFTRQLTSCTPATRLPWPHAPHLQRPQDDAVHGPCRPGAPNSALSPCRARPKATPH